jgi:2-octaprenyl-6-methoxyphenol hydroxylase
VSAYRVVIAGGGMVGVSLALALARRAPDCEVLLVESFPLPALEPDFADAYSPSFDARSTALSYGSSLIYSEWGCWDCIAPHAQAIDSIHVSEQGRFGSTLMRAGDYDWPALGYVVENAWFGNSLLSALQDTSVQTRSPARVVSAVTGVDQVELELDDGDCLSADLLVVADGAQSGLRDALGIRHLEESYDQQAIIANIGHRRDHGGCAFERFTATGPLAMLPLPPEGRHRSALVWTLPPEEAAALMECVDSDFLARLQREFGYRLGRLEQLGERHSYPLSLVQAEEQVRSGVVVIGNAAHALHPVAGQGFNLALRDIACLVAKVAKATSEGLSPGNLAVLDAYRDSQDADQRQTTAFSDHLPGLFMQRDPALSTLRDLGLFALDLSPALKREFVRQTAGLAVSTGYRDARP